MRRVTTPLADTALLLDLSHLNPNHAFTYGEAEVVRRKQRAVFSLTSQLESRLSTSIRHSRVATLLPEHSSLSWA